MIQLPYLDLHHEAMQELADLQREIDALPTYTERVRVAAAGWPARRKRRVFQAVEAALGALCSGPRRCMYCEDNSGYQIEHFRPKALYPRLVFAWANYLYACGECNGPKGDRFAIFSEDGAVNELVRAEADPPEAPSVLLDPRSEEPMDYLRLDLCGTFLFEPVHAHGTPGYKRADYTIRWLQLNLRPALVESRRVAYEDYHGRLEAYAGRKLSGADAAILERLRSSLRRKGHVTVWREMQRQHTQIGELKELFSKVPEALEG